MAGDVMMPGRKIGLMGAVAALVVLALPIEVVAQTWRLERGRDPFTDEPRIIASVLTRDLSVGVRCIAGTLDAVVLSGYIGDDASNVRYRVDQGPVRETVWDTSVGRDGLFAWAPSEFARDLVAGNRLTFEYSDFSGQRHIESVGLRGSAATINAVLDACSVPRADPRAANPEIWRRAVQDLDKAPADLVEGVQLILRNVGQPVELSGRRDEATYLALSRVYADYREQCAAGEVDGTGSCGTWQASRRYNPDADYPVEPLELLVELSAARRAEDAVGGVADVAPELIRGASAEDIARFYPERARELGVEGAATIECSVSEGRRLQSCLILSETPIGQGLGRATVQMASRMQARPASGSVSV